MVRTAKRYVCPGARGRFRVGTAREVEIVVQAPLSMLWRIS
jgi:hypothetical protein